MGGIRVPGEAGKWVTLCCYVLFNGLTVTQTNTSETDGYLSGKGQWQSSCPFLCPCIKLLFFYFEGEKLAATTQPCRQKHLSSSFEREVEESLTLMACDRGKLDRDWLYKMSRFLGCDRAYILCGDLIAMHCWLTRCYCWWWNLPWWAWWNGWLWTQSIVAFLFAFTGQLATNRTVVKHQISSVFQGTTMFLSCELFMRGIGNI